MIGLHIVELSRGASSFKRYSFGDWLRFQNNPVSCTAFVTRLNKLNVSQVLSRTDVKAIHAWSRHVTWVRPARRFQFHFVPAAVFESKHREVTRAKVGQANAGNLFAFDHRQQSAEHSCCWSYLNLLDIGCGWSVTETLQSGSEFQCLSSASVSNLSDVKQGSPTWRPRARTTSVGPFW